MGYTNSSLVSYTKLSPNHSGLRKHKIDTITIHCIVGQCSVETIGNIFSPKSRQASSNYGIGLDGRVGMYVEEKNRSWCTSSSSNDHRAITIEVASDTTHPYAVRDVVYKSLIELLVDICKRNDIKKLLWAGDKGLIGKVDKQNMTVHRWFSNKSCPGDWLYSRHGEIAELVNNSLMGDNLDNVDPGNNVPTIIKVGDVVRLLPGAKQYNNKAIKSGYETKDYVVKEIKGDRVVLTIDGIVVYAVNIKDLVPLVDSPTKTPVKTPTANVGIKEYRVKITCDVLNIRRGPGTSNKVVGQIKDRGVYTITQVGGKGSWGRLKSGAGWIHLGYTKKI